jgi:uncharacterized membrane protein
VSRTTVFVVGIVLVVLGVAAHVFITHTTKAPLALDVVSLVPALLGAHLVSRTFLRELVNGVKARWGDK